VSGLPTSEDDQVSGLIPLEDGSHRPRLVASPAPAEAPTKADVLAVLEAEIIPRLRLAHRHEPLSASCSESRLPPTEEEVFEFAQLAVSHDLPAALAFVTTLCQQGLSLEVVLLDLVAAAARLLGEHWKTDLRTFTEVTAGLGTLQQVVHIFGPSFAPSLPSRGLVVLVPAPGEQHTLGLFLVGEFFRRAGWAIHIDPAMSESEVVNLLRARSAAMLGISVSSPASAGSAVRLIAAARNASLNPDIAIVLGGSADLTGLAAQTGATLCSSNPRDAISMLEQRSKAPRFS
jgi:methanogenic corrinoid protein MtbC1